MKYVENLALNYSVELLFDENPFFENTNLLTNLKKHFNNVEILFSTSNISSFVFNDYTTCAEGIEIPVQILVIKENAQLNMIKLKHSLDQTIDWNDAELAIDKCNFALVISDFMATEIKYNDRIFLFNKFLKALLEVLPCTAIHWSYSQKVVEPLEYQNALEQESLYSLYGIVNVRYFKKDSYYIMDSIGLSALGLPDLQCKFKNIDTGIIATILYEYANNIFEKGDYINDDTKIKSMDFEFRCHHEFSLTAPKRIVLNLEII